MRMRYFYLFLGILLVVISACVSPPVEENITEQTTTTLTTLMTTTSTTTISSNESKCEPICRAIGTRSEGWYDSCTNKLIKYENCGTAITTILKTTTTSTTTTTTTTTTTIKIRYDITISKIGKYQLLMNFTGTDNRVYGNVHLDSGPFYINDVFVVNGHVYKYLNYKEKQNHKVEIKMRDEISGNTLTYTLDAYNGTPFELKTYSFEESSANDKKIKIMPDSNIETTSVYNGTAFGIPVLFNDGDLYIGVDNRKIVGVTASVIGPNYMESFKLNGIKITAIDENGINLNRDSTGHVADDDNDDTIIKIKDNENEFVYVDFYDRNYNRDKHYSESVKASSKDITNTQIGTLAVTIDNPEDSLLILPGSGYRIKITYGSDNSIKSIRIFV